MILTCPSCDARFKVPDKAIGKYGRMVRCSKCSHEWFQDPVSDEKTTTLEAPKRREPAAASKPRAIVAAAEEEEAPAAVQASHEEETETEGGADEEPADFAATMRGFSANAGDRESFGPIPRAARVPAYARPQARQRSGAGALVLLGLVALVAAGAVLGRSSIVAAWAPAARLYEVIGLPVPVPGAGLKLADIKAERRTEGGIELLVVKGLVTNGTQDVLAVPLLRASLRTDDRRELQAWVFQAEAPTLLPGEAVGFVTEFANPDASATDLTISFTPGS